MDTFEKNSLQVACSLAAGISIADAARAAGLSQRTVTRWLSRGRREPGSRYAAFATAVEEAQAVEVSDAPMTDHEFRVLVSRAVRRGSIAAMRLYLEILELDRQRGTSKPEDPLAFADELAVRRGRHPEAS